MPSSLVKQKLKKRKVIVKKKTWKDKMNLASPVSDPDSGLELDVGEGG